MVAAFKEKMIGTTTQSLTFEKLETLQINMGNRCNQTCAHCHVDASPVSRKVMGKEIVEKIIHYASNHKGLIYDITGGCPEINPHFRMLVEQIRPYADRIMVRSNLTILFEKGYGWLPAFYRDNDIVIVASLPCYTEENVDTQRGKGVFNASIDGLQLLNAYGYGTTRELDLVFNPGGNFLPGNQKELEDEYTRELADTFGITFNHLFTITNAPLGRFKAHLITDGSFDDYLKLLSDNFNPRSVKNVMCRRLISVDWLGKLYNCDFNQAAGLSLMKGNGRPYMIDDIEDIIHDGVEIMTADHCYCCTAGEGSSCTGSLS